MTGPKVSQFSFDLFSLSFPEEAGTENMQYFFCASLLSLWFLNWSVLTSSGTHHFATVPLMIYQWLWYAVFDIWYISAFDYPHHTHTHTWPYWKGLCVCICGVNVFWSEGRHCYSGWSSLGSQTPVKEVVLHLPKGHLKHISYIIVHSLNKQQRHGVKAKNRVYSHTTD